jgi:twitching motility protein PilT
VLRAVISQRLVPRADGKGRVPAIEVLLATGRVRELIEDKDRTKEISEAIAQGHLSYGMQTFDQSLMSLLRAQVISYEEALRQATNPDDFALRVSGIASTSDSKWDSFESSDGNAPPASRAPPVMQRAPGPPAPAAGASRMTPAKGTARPAPAPGGGTAADDDFQIERF